MNRRDLFRQAFLGAAAAASAGVAPALEFPSDYDASKELAREDWKPLLLGDHQNQTLIAFSDMLIPETDTPGARAPLVDRFLDRVLAAKTHEKQRGFLDGLAFLDGNSFGRDHAALEHLTLEATDRSRHAATRDFRAAFSTVANGVVSRLTLDTSGAGSANETR
jgi:hypothetical protein